MEYNKIQNDLQYHIDFYGRRVVNSIKWDEYKNLENAYKNNFLKIALEERASYLHKWMHNIGKEVYISKKSFNYAIVDTFETEINSLNQKYFDTTKSIVFTQNVFDKLCFDYCEFQVQRLIEELTEKSITINSTSKITNLVFEWCLECKQELIQIFKEIGK
jgi:hypothetical protein